MNALQEQAGAIAGRVFVEFQPGNARQAWAQKSGGGWIGKNSLLLNRQQSSFFFHAQSL